MPRPDEGQRARVPELLRAAGGMEPGSPDRVAADSGVAAAAVQGVGSFFHLLADPATKVRVCQGPACRMSGSAALLEAARERGLPSGGCSCLAACDRAPAVLRGRSVLPELRVSDLEACGGNWEALRTAALEGEEFCSGEIGFRAADREQGRLGIDLSGELDFSMRAWEGARARGAESLLAELETSGLQGRGGAGFPAAAKWKAVRAQTETRRYVVLNADEGEPGTFKDREILLRRPDRVLEGLAIAAWAVGAAEIWCYLRGEFQAPMHTLRAALARFGEEAFGGLRFHFHFGDGAYICGEETALLEALEGRRGMPRLKPPYPTEKGLWGRPTLIHNVETIACVPGIALRSGAWFRELGLSGPGTKLYCLSGDVRRPGVYELPLGVTLRELLACGGGCRGELKAYSPGGASSGFLPAALADLPLDYSALAAQGSMLGSAGVVIYSTSRNIAVAALELLSFFEAESCGQCAPCRIGTRYLREAVEKQWEEAPLEEIAWEMREASICGLGQAAPLALESARKWFPEDFHA